MSKEEFASAVAADPRFDGEEADVVWWLAMLPLLLEKWKAAEGDRVLHVFRIPILPNIHLTVNKVADLCLFILDIFGVNQPTEEDVPAP